VSVLFPPCPSRVVNVLQLVPPATSGSIAHVGTQPLLHVLGLPLTADITIQMDRRNHRGGGLPRQGGGHRLQR